MRPATGSTQADRLRLNDTFYGGAGADTFVLGDGDDRVDYERLSDGASKASPPWRLRPHQGIHSCGDKISFGVEFNGGASNLDDHYRRQQSLCHRREGETSPPLTRLVITSAKSASRLSWG